MQVAATCAAERLVMELCHGPPAQLSLSACSQIAAAALIFAALLVLLPMAPVGGFTDDVASQSNLFL
jgi:hypothetical protein